MKHTLLLCLLLVFGNIATAQVYDSAIRYKNSSLSFEVAMDTLIQHAASPVDTSEENQEDMLTRFKEFMGGRISLDVADGADMYAPMASAVSTYLSEIGSSCTSAGNWQCLGPFNNYNETQSQGRINAVWVNPVSGSILAGADGGGVWKSVNDGNSWHCITDAAGGGVLGMCGISWIAVDPLDTNVIYISLSRDEQYTKSAGYSLGLAYTTDGGSTWNTDNAFATALAMGPAPQVTKIAYKPGTEQLYAISGDLLMVKPTPASAWGGIPASGGGIAWNDMEFSNITGDPILTSSASGGSSGLWDYTGGGYTVSWAGGDMVLPTGYTMDDDVDGGQDFTITAADTAYIRFYARDDSGARVCLLLKTSISDINMQMLNDDFPPPDYAGITDNDSLYFEHFQVSHGNGQVIYAANYWAKGPFFQSTDQGNSFSSIAASDHVDGRCLYISRDSSNPLYDEVIFGCDGGVSKKFRGYSYTQSITGDSLAVTEFYGLGNTEANENIIVCGAQDNGGFSYVKNRLQPWDIDLYYLDGANAKMLPDNIENAIGEANHPKLFSWIFDDIYSSTTYIEFPNYPIGEGSSENRPIHFGPNDIEHIGYCHIFKKAPADTEWQRAFPADPIDVSGGPHGAFDFYIDDNNNNNAYIAYAEARGTDTFGRLFYSFDAQSSSPLPTWTDITPSLCATNQINSIAVDPDNANRIWVAFGNINNDMATTGLAYMTNRVWFSNDYGATWTDESVGLPAMPVGKILYRKGSQDELYAGTDVGVFKWNPATLEWECFNNGLPVCVVNDMEMNYCAGKLRIATYGRGIWETPLPDIIPKAGLNTTITTNTTWNQDMWLQESVDVQAPATLTMSGGHTIHMPKNGVIAVEPGAHLIVDNDTITNSCDQCFWQGIQARGNGSLPQNPASNQGWVTIEHNSTITNAYDGVANYNESLGAGWWGSQGGIIQCLGANFVDNKVCASFVAYDNYYPAGVLHNNSSFFKNCTFLLDNNYKGNTTGDVMENMVNMQGVEGIYFDGDQFLNRDTVAYKDTGEGIHAMNTGFYVQEYCPIPTGTGTPPPCIPSRFCGFRNGIDVRDALWAVPVSIDQAQFDSCSVGINVSSFNNVSATRNTFIIGHGGSVQYAGPMSDSNCFENIGILMQNSSQFRIEGNDFKGKPNASLYAWNNYGTIVSESGANTNTIYRNTFDSLTYGAYNIGVNASGLFSGPGLKVLCNTFTNNTTDIYVARDGSTTTVQGIAKIQGTEDYSASFLYIPAGNTFSGSTNNIINTGQFIDYYYTGGVSGSAYPPVVAPASGAGSVGRLHTDGSNSCAPSYGSVTTIPGSITGALDMGALRGLKQSYLTAQALLEDSMSAYNIRIDMGNTPGLVATIVRSTDTAALYATLSGGSPYLSETALKAVAGHAALPYLSMLYLLEQNPDDARDGDFLAYIQNVYSFTPTDMTAIARSSLANTARTAIEGSMEGMQDAMAMEANLIMMALKTASDTNVSVTDTTRAGICTDSTSVFYTLDSTSVYWGLDSVDTWLQNIGSLWTNYDRAWYYNWTGQYSVANRIFTSISGILPAQAADTVAYNSYAQMWDVIYNADINGRSMWQLDSTDVAGLSSSTLDSFVYNTGEMMMDVVRHYHDPEPVYADACHWPCSDCLSLGGKNAPGGGQSPQPIININASNTDYDFEAYPNPTSGVVTFSYNMPTGTGGNMKITVTNIVGEKVWEQTSSSAGKMYWDPVNMAAGVYLYQASDDKGIVSKGKLVVVR